MLRASSVLAQPAKLQPPRRAGVHVRVLQARGAEQPQREEGPNDGARDALLMALKTALLASAVSAVAAQPAAARSARGWQARRHRRRLVDKEVFLEQEAPMVSAQTVAQAAPQPQAAQGALQDLQRSMRRAYRKAKRAIRGDAVYVEQVSGRQMPAYSSSRFASGAPAPALSGVGWLALWAAGLAALYMLVGRKISWPWSGRQRGGQGGRWVYDRSLGGKMVFVPETPKPTRSLWGDDLPSATASTASAEKAATDFSDKLASTIGYGGTGAAAAGSGAAGRAAAALVPEWWVPPNTAVYVPAGRREELQQQAKAALRELEDAKLAGMDYPLSTLRTLRMLCQEGGGLQVKPRTENGRDSMLKAGVRAAMDCAVEGSRGLLDGAEPGRFVSGLAHDLGVPDQRAVEITHNEVAQACRSLLVEAEAAYRAGDQQGEIMFALYKLRQLLAAFPLPPGSAQLDLIAGNIHQFTSMEFRRAIFFTFGYMDDTRAPIVAEMLGFNPELVMPQLLLQIQAARQAEALQQAEQLAAEQGGEQRQQQAQQQGEAGEGPATAGA